MNFVSENKISLYVYYHYISELTTSMKPHWNKKNNQLFNEDYNYNIIMTERFNFVFRANYFFHNTRASCHILCIL